MRATVSRHLGSEEFTFDDGTTARSPVELAALLEAAPARVEELWPRFRAGDLARWLRHLGMEEAALGVEHLHAQGEARAEVLPRLVRLLKGEPETMTRGVGQAAGPQPRLAADILARGPLTARARPVVAPVQPRRQESRLAYRLQVALQTFRRAEEDRAQIEEAETRRARAEEEEAEQAALAVKAPAQARLAEARQAWQDTRQTLDRVSLADLLREAQVSLPQAGTGALPDASTELDRAAGLARQAAAGVAAKVAELQYRRATKSLPRVLAAVGSVPALFITTWVVTNWLVAMLVLPLGLGLAIALFRLESPVWIAERLTGWVSRPVPASPIAARQRRLRATGLRFGVAWIARWSGGIQNPYVRAAVQIALSLYYMYLLVYLVVVAVTVSVEVALALIMLYIVLAVLSRSSRGK